jgi:hypothetical protein
MDQAPFNLTPDLPFPADYIPAAKGETNLLGPAVGAGDDINNTEFRQFGYNFGRRLWGNFHSLR